ncbi:hypothetical protein [Pandoraea captiosa]|uniref:hypothetical protein n=1 Tax=Pandoraea captiosa TaxID=2508302 RepID=UPI0012404B15|nr:hypothetical protein [Pandoraea captiosa]
MTEELSPHHRHGASQWSKPAPRNDYVTANGTINGVDIKVVFGPKAGRIVTGYPTNLPRNQE